MIDGVFFFIWFEEVGRVVIVIFFVFVFVNSDVVNFVIFGEVVLVDLEKLDCVLVWVISDVMVCIFEEVWF